uniref:Uncharacterized protein n=1 Tax=Arundo donax TaxID=35708 RepID=A0A0A9ENY5_ARUDO
MMLYVNIGRSFHIHLQVITLDAHLS